MNDETNTLVNGVDIFIRYQMCNNAGFPKCFKSNEAWNLMDVLTNLSRNILLNWQIKYKLYNNS